MAAVSSAGTAPATSIVATAAAPPAKIRFCMCSTFSPASRSSSSTRARTPTSSTCRTVRVALPRPRGARLTQLRASPAANASTISTTPAATAAWACAVEAPMWWVATTCGWRASGESHSAVPEPGSSANTSRPARTRPASSAASSAASSTTSPREVFTRSAPGLIASRKSASTRFLVSGDAGTCRLTTSDAASSSGRVAKPTASSSASRSLVAWLRPARCTQPIRIPNAAARSATARPIEPRPTIPSVLPSSPLALL